MSTHWHPGTCWLRADEYDPPDVIDTIPTLAGDDWRAGYGDPPSLVRVAMEASCWSDGPPAMETSTDGVRMRLLTRWAKKNGPDRAERERRAEKRRQTVVKYQLELANREAREQARWEEDRARRSAAHAALGRMRHQHVRRMTVQSDAQSHLPWDYAAGPIERLRARLQGRYGAWMSCEVTDDDVRTFLFQDASTFDMWDRDFMCMFVAD